MRAVMCKECLVLSQQAGLLSAWVYPSGHILDTKRPLPD